MRLLRGPGDQDRAAWCRAADLGLERDFQPVGARSEGRVLGNPARMACRIRARVAQRDPGLAAERPGPVDAAGGRGWEVREGQDRDRRARTVPIDAMDV